MLTAYWVPQANCMGNLVGCKCRGDKTAAAGAGADAVTVASAAMKSSSFSFIFEMLVGSETICNINGTCIGQAATPC